MRHETCSLCRQAVWKAGCARSVRAAPRGGAPHLKPDVLFQDNGAQAAVHGHLCKVLGQLHAFGIAQLLCLHRAAASQQDPANR